MGRALHYPLLHPVLGAFDRKLFLIVALVYSKPPYDALEGLYVSLKFRVDELSEKVILVLEFVLVQ